MKLNSMGRIWAAIALALVVWLAPGSDRALAFDDPSLLPDEQTPIVDLADLLPSGQENALIDRIGKFEAETGWRLRVLTQYDRTPGRAVIPFWGLDRSYVVMVADTRGGNLLSFAVADDVYELIPRTFWIELQSRFGNLYYVRDNGRNAAIAAALGVVESCLRQGGCNVVPGIPREQWILTLVTSIAGGIIFGFAATPRKPDQVFAWQWALIFSPLWGILFVAFGIGPVVTRTTDWVPLLRNVLGFVGGALVAYLSPLLGQNATPEEEL